jgi:UDP-N-acetylglucosamine 4,6-dehydratase
MDMESEFAGYAKTMRYIMGSVTDHDSISRACKGIDYVVHTAALKVVPKAQYNPKEVMRVNYLGTENVIDACIERKVKRAVFLGTDKGVEAVNLYGKSKAAAEDVWIESNYMEPIFSSVRYGNVMGSRGAVITKFLEQRERGEKDYEITHPECTRFWVDFDEAIQLVMKSFDEKPGIITASKTRSSKIKDLIKAIYLRADLKVTGLREGEKIHETIVNQYEAQRSMEMDDCYRIFPLYSYEDKILYDKEHGRPVPKAVTSGDFLNLMTLEEVRAKVDKFVGRLAR